MAEAVITPTVEKVSDNGQELDVRGTLAIEASPATYTTGGLPLSAARFAGLVPSSTLEDIIVTGISGFVYQWDKANGKLLVFCNTAGGSNAALGQHTAAAVAAGVSSDTLRFRALFRKF